MRYSLIAVVLIVLAVVGVIYFYLAYPQTQNNVFISLIDPPNVPHGTQSLNITYSSVMVHTISGNSSAWVSAPGSGTLNLLSLINVSVVLGSLYVPNGSKINMIRFNVTSASIELNNTVYPVTLPNAQITAKVTTNTSVNGTTNLITELSPTVITVFTANSTVFIMVPSVRAVSVGNSKLRGATIGSEHGLDIKELHALRNNIANISISNTSLSSVSNITHLSVTVKDNSNQSIIIRHITLFGNQLISVDNISVGPSGNISREDRGGFGTANSSGYDSGYNNTYTSGEYESEIDHQGILQASFKTINFLVAQNGTLFLPALGSNFEGEGYTLAAGQSFTFNFNGRISLGENHVSVNLVSGSTYRVVIQGQEGARATANVTAS